MMISYNMRASFNAVLMSMSCVGLVPPASRDNQQRTTLYKINPLTWAVIDAHFRDAFANRFHIPGIAVPQPEYSCLHPGPCLCVTQGLKPCRKFQCFADFDHGRSVIYGLH
jgi:hypothetical protein